MGPASLPVMDDDRERREALAAAGYTGARGAALFCALLAAVGALLGSVVLAILWNVAAPGSPESVSTGIGAAAGGLLGVLLGLLKIRQGNLDAREQVEDREWRRLVRRQHMDRAR
ncbi:hypothetical protein [Hyphomicrobium sp.]|uniref:hypothetical protein n=1 Tax=Hyphomicrobium sp. TaxID=82 RepID=UPI0025BECE9B|nr:hypothetical protein [Hyphomicrobium sp.]MCC7251145.1 hypothetical protein [Hyphomicrobium sp.]